MIVLFSTHNYYKKTMLNKISLKASKERNFEEKIYAQVAIELSEGIRHDGIWLKALSNSDGNEEDANKLYIKYRVQSIKDNLIIAHDSLEAEKNQQTKKFIINSLSNISAILLLIPLSVTLLFFVKILDDLSKGSSSEIYFLDIFWLIISGGLTHMIYKYAIK